LVPDSISIGTVWETHASEATKRAYFASLNTLFVYTPGAEEGIEVYPFENMILSILEWDGRVYISEENNGLWELRDEGLLPGPHQAFFGDSNVHSMLETPSGRLFCSYAACYAYRPERPARAFAQLDTPALEYAAENVIGGALALRDGSLLLNTYSGGIVHTDARGNLIRILNTETGLPTNAVYGLHEDASGSVWAATVNGLVRIDFSLPLRRFDERNGISDMPGKMIEHNGALWFTRTNGIYKLNAEYQAEQMLEAPNCYSYLLEFTQTNELITLCDDRLYGMRNEVFRVIGDDNIHKLGVQEVVTPAGPVSFVMMLRDSRLHLLQAGSIAELAQRLAAEDYAYSLDISSDLNSFAWDERQTLWVGSEANGLYRIQFDMAAGGDGLKITGHRVSQHFQRLENVGNYKDIKVTRLAGRPVFLTWGAGVQQFNYQKDDFEAVTRYGEFFTDPEVQFFRIKEDEQGHLWVRGGLDYQAALQQQAETEQPGFFIYEGALKRITDKQNNAIYPDSQGFIWYATARGLVRYDQQMEGIAAYDRPPHVEISEVFIRDTPLFEADSLASESFAAPDAITLNYSENELRFTFAANAYHEHEANEYRVKLAGFDQNWSTWTSESFKDYTNIPEGSYDFQVEARDIYGQTVASAPLSFTIKPPWHRTVWAYMVYALLIGGGLYTGFTIRLRQLTRLYRVRNRIASDLHDEISATLSSISYFAEAVERDKTGQSQQRFISLISDSASDAKEKISDIVWAINPEHDDWRAFLSKCRRFATDLLESRDIQHDIRIDEDLPGRLDMQLRQHLWMIYKEMLTNAVRHSGAGRVQVELHYRHGRLRLMVQDDGCGIDEQTLHGNGLHNIEKRAKAINGKLKVHSTTKGKHKHGTSGTRWELEVKP
ncbi:MAG: ATP-binding protein, partial [Cyclonatronaceae bacterium]